MKDDADDAFDGRNPVIEFQKYFGAEIAEIKIFDESDEDVCTCALCGKSGYWGDPSTGRIKIWWAFSQGLFCGRQKEHALMNTFCLDCAKKVIPYAIRLRDIDEAKKYVNKLERTIREKVRTS